MLTVAEARLAELARAHGQEVSIHLFGQEVNPETYAITKADLLLKGEGVEAFFRREVLPHVPDAWIDKEATRVGYEISFTRYFYKPQPLRTLEEIRADIEALQKETEGLLEQILVDTEAD
jgi:type I restriction enzyme M protein